MKNILLILIVVILGSIATYFILKTFFPKSISDKDRFEDITETLNETIQENQFTTSAWLPYWDYENSLQEVKDNFDLFDSISPFIYVLAGNGDIQIKISDEELFETMNLSGLQVIPTISNEFDAQRVSRIINNDDLLKKHVAELSDIVNVNKYDGIEIDYEYLDAEDKDAFSNFIKILSTELSLNNKTLIVTLHPKTDEIGDWSAKEAQDWQEISKYADFVRIMAYDYHWSTSEPGPIAPISWVEEVALYATKNIPEEKMIMGIGYYGYDWPSEGDAKSINLTEANDLSSKNGVDIVFDPESQSPYFTYQSEDGTHTVWYEDEKSLMLKNNIAQNYYKGITIWRLGGLPHELLKSL